VAQAIPTLALPVVVGQLRHLCRLSTRVAPTIEAIQPVAPMFLWVVRATSMCRAASSGRCRSTSRRTSSFRSGRG